MREKTPNLPDKAPNIAREPELCASSFFQVWLIWPLLDTLFILPPLWDLKKVSGSFKEELH